jgi:uncharacterized protein (DUF1800 family)
MTPSPVDLQRYARRVGFGLAPGERLDGDPIGWAVAQLRVVPPIAIMEPDGSPRADLPEGLRLRGSGDELMHAWQRHMDTVAEVRARSASLGEAAFRREFTERVSIPYSRLEPWKEVQARATTAVHGPAPVFERFWHFWTNHFTVAPGTMQNEVLVGPHQRVLRERMTGSFRELLWQAVTHPGMLVYLDNVRNTGPNSRARRERWTRDSVNENLGRELLELFTLSPAAGYTQQDVEQATLVLTGWRVQRPDRSHRPGIPLGTRFTWDWHEPGAQTVLGKRYTAWFKPESKLAELVDDLAAHPATARHLAHKLCVQFIDDEPPADAVAEVERAWLDSGGHLPAIHEAVLRAAWRTLGSTRKFASPEAWFLQVHRCSGLAPPRALPLPGDNGPKTFYLLGDLGQALPRCPQPNGWPIRSSDWLSRELLDRRARLSQLLATMVVREAGAPAQERVAALVDTHWPAEPGVGGGGTLARQALARRDPARALALMWLSPEFLWS